MKKPVLLKKDKLGGIILAKRILMTIAGMVTYPNMFISNKMNIKGIEYLDKLPKRNVLFVSNHQTYFADVIALHHVFSKLPWRKISKYACIFSFLTPKIKTYYVAAEETMRERGIIPKIFAYLGAITVRRHWRYGNIDVSRGADVSVSQKIKQGLLEGWVVNFPQGTTKPFAPVQKGTAHIIKAFNPIVVIVYIDGFRRAFDKTGLINKKRGTRLNIEFHEPIQFIKENSLEEISDFIFERITKRYPLVSANHEFSRR